MPERDAAVTASGAIGDALPLDILVQRIDPDVLSALARWRDIDPLSLSGLKTALVTESGDAAINHNAYLTALHGFVAERITYDTLSLHHSTVFPDQTNVPALDLIVDGEPLQIKEGVTAKDAVQHALHRYPDVTHFATDPKAARQLNGLGIDAVGIPGLEPDRIARETRDSLAGLNALEHAGDVHVPILTTVFSLCRYWERFDSGRIEARSAVMYGAVDIGAQAVGSAMGLKVAAIAVVATGGFTFAALPLTAGAIIGALGLRNLVKTQRLAKLRGALDELESVRRAAEAATKIVIELSGDYTRAELAKSEAALNADRDSINARWDEAWSRAEHEAAGDLDSLCVATLHETEYPVREALQRRLDRIRSIYDTTERALALRRALRIALRAIPKASDELIHHLRLGCIRAEARSKCLRELVNRCNWEASWIAATAKRDLQIALITEYVVLLDRLAQMSSRVATSLSKVRREAERLGADWERVVPVSGDAN